MLGTHHKKTRSRSWSQAKAPLGRPGARMDYVKKNDSSLVSAELTDQAQLDSRSVSSSNVIDVARQISAGKHPLTRKEMNAQLFGYENRIKSMFDAIEPAIKEAFSLQAGANSEAQARAYIREKLGMDVPELMTSNFQNGSPENYMHKLYAWCLFEAYQNYGNMFWCDFPNPMGVNEFNDFIQACGFHTVDVSPCADGRLAHVISYVMRMPYRAVRRKSYAGALFDIEDSLDKWVETELLRFREGKPNTADEQTRYLKIAVYHFSSSQPGDEGCAAHGSNAQLAAQAGKERLVSFKQAVENTYCCGASIDQLLIGMDTDTDVIRVHVPDDSGEPKGEKFIDAKEIYNATYTMTENVAKTWIRDFVEGASPLMSEGMTRFITFLLINNISQIDYVNSIMTGINRILAMLKGLSVQAWVLRKYS